MGVHHYGGRHTDFMVVNKDGHIVPLLVAHLGRFTDEWYLLQSHWWQTSRMYALAPSVAQIIVVKAAYEMAALRCERAQLVQRQAEVRKRLRAVKRVWAALIWLWGHDG